MIQRPSEGISSQQSQLPVIPPRTSTTSLTRFGKVPSNQRPLPPLPSAPQTKTLQKPPRPPRPNMAQRVINPEGQAAPPRPARGPASPKVSKEVSGDVEQNINKTKQNLEEIGDVARNDRRQKIIDGLKTAGWVLLGLAVVAGVVASCGALGIALGVGAGIGAAWSATNIFATGFSVLSTVAFFA